MQSISEAAIHAIGDFKPLEDWRIDPDSHAAAMPREAETLREVLLRPDLTDLMARFRTADARAGDEQKRYKRYGRLAIALNTFAAITGAVALFTGAVLSGDLAGQPLAAAAQTGAAWLPIMQIALIVGALVSAQVVIRLQPFDKWMKSRAEAEIVRNELFWRVLTAHENPSVRGPIPLLPLQLEYYRRYHLQTQLAYYAQRGGQHKNAAEGQRTRAGLYTVVAAFVAAPLPFLFAAFFGENAAIAETLGGTFLERPMAYANQWLSSPLLNEGFALAGVVAGALLAGSEASRLLSQDTRNASRYAATYENLRFLTNRYLPAAREAAAMGDHESVLAFVAAVNEQISAEHKEWILLQEESAMPELTSISSRNMRRLQQRVG